MEDRHTGVNIEMSLKNLIGEMDISTDIPWYCISDNASNMKLAKELSERLIEYFCNNHTIQLMINDAFKDTDGMKKLLADTKSIAKFTNKSEPARKLLEEECKQAGIKFKTLKNPNDTRWNSAEANLSSVLYLKEAIEAAADKN